MSVALALAVAAASASGLTTPVNQVPVSDLIGKTPAQVAERLRIEPDHADRVVAAAIETGQRITVADSRLWLKGSAICPPDSIGRINKSGDWDSIGVSRFIFVDGRLAHIKPFAADFLAKATDDDDDLSGAQPLSIVCQTIDHGQVSDQILVGLTFAPYAAYRAVHIALRHSEGASLIARFKLGEAAPDLGPLHAEHPEAISAELQPDGDQGVRIRYGGSDIGGDPPADWATNYDFHVELTDGKVTAIWQGVVMGARCVLTPAGAMACS
jgi:hypothetical protein